MSWLSLVRDDTQESGKTVVWVRLFSRQVLNKGVVEYLVEDKVVPWSRYEVALAEIDVLMKVHNFLVFEGNVKSIKRKSP